MKSNKAKVLHEIGGKPLVLRSVETAERLGHEKPVVVVGRDADAVRALLGERVQFVSQAQLLGTGHAVMQAEATLRGQADLVVVYYADMPLLRPATIQTLIDQQRHNPGPITLLTVIQPDPRGFGRIVRDSAGTVIDIVEERECTPDQLLIRELNPGVYCFRGEWLWDNLHNLRVRANGEYYLTDTIPLATAQGLPNLGVPHADLDELIGINTRVHLADAEAALRRRLNREWMLNGVTLQDPQTTYIEDDVMIGQDTVILPNTHLRGQTHIGAHCVIGPDTSIVDSVIGDECHVSASVIEEATLERQVRVGPFSHLRKGAYLAEGVHMGNFGEVKNSRLGPGTRMGHFSYVGDAEVGEDVNIGAGTITANFDGVKKHKTTIGDHAFIGSDTILRAPVTVGPNAKTGAGSVVTKNVPEGHIAVGVPARMRAIVPPPASPTAPAVPTAPTAPTVPTAPTAPTVPTVPTAPTAPAGGPPASPSETLSSSAALLSPERIEELRQRLRKKGDVADEMLAKMDAQGVVDLARLQGLAE
jgi:bifunctional UDP-N-acetylglucosamine pyrophosphorylase/glucosamine-1-phosphate N-acetyltransferase